MTLTAVQSAPHILTREEIQGRAALLEKMVGLRGAARELGIARATLIGLLAGRRVMPSTLALIRERLAAKGCP